MRDFTSPAAACQAENRNWLPSAEIWFMRGTDGLRNKRQPWELGVAMPDVGAALGILAVIAVRLAIELLL